MAKACPAAQTVASEYHSDRLRLLGPLVTKRALELARGRILNTRSRLVGEKGALPTADEEGVVKIALLLVREMNPAEWLTNEEEALLHGITAATFAKRRGAGEI